MNETYCIFTCTNGKYPFAIAALCREDQKQIVEDALGRVSTWEPDSDLDLVTLDAKIAELVSSVCPKNIQAAAAIIKLWENGPASGGVIGNPQEDSVSAQIRLEEIAPSLWEWAYPGNCGFVINGNWNKGCEAVDVVYGCISRNEDPWLKFKQWFLNSKVIAFLYASDASGKTGRLCAGNKQGIQEIII